MDKRGLELAVNTLVVIILGTVIVIGGIALVYKLVSKTQATLDEVPARMQDEIFNMLLSQKTKIIALENTKEVNKGTTATFIIAFQNTLGSPSSFKIDASKLALSPARCACSAATPSTCSVGGTTYVCPTTQFFKDTSIIQPNGKQAFYVIVDVKPNTYAGEYTFEVDVLKSDQPYALTKVNVNVI